MLSRERPGSFIAKKKTSMKERGIKSIPSRSYSRLGNYDVVFGSTTNALTTIGNRRFRVTLDLAIEQFRNRNDQQDWGAMIDSVTDLIQKVGGRFFNREEKLFVLLSREEAKLKVGFVLRQRVLSLSTQVKSCLVGPSTNQHGISFDRIVSPRVATPTSLKHSRSSDGKVPSLLDCDSHECMELAFSFTDISDDELSLDNDPVDWLPSSDDMDCSAYSERVFIW